MSMLSAPANHRSPRHVIIVGAGIAGLACALRLSAAGLRVTVLERAEQPGGKMRTLPSAAGPVDAGPTVLTMRSVFDTLFKDVGARLADHVSLAPLQTLARHYWRDGPMLDLRADPAESADNITEAFGVRSAEQFRAFSARAKRLFMAFDAPMMRAARPSTPALIAQTLRQPQLIADMAPHRTLAALLGRSFDEPRLAQLFARYATYVGGTPANSPALLALIWQAEAAGVWHVAGGMQSLARAIESLAKDRGAEFHYDTQVASIHPGSPMRVHTDAGQFSADAVVFNGDPRALAKGVLGASLRSSVRRNATTPRSLSANVIACATRPVGAELAHHTVFFGDDPGAEFAAIANRRVASDSTLYICAQDRTDTDVPTNRAPLERLQIIQNAPAILPDRAAGPDEGTDACLTKITERLGRFGLTLTPPPTAASLTQPAGFAALFPASLGALYGRSPSGLTAALKRPTARSRIPGLYLAGGGAHPGAGVPMATLSAQHAAAAILQDLTSP